MDFGEVFRIVGQFFINYCGITVSVFGISFTIGSLFIWCAVALILVVFIRGIVG